MYGKKHSKSNLNNPLFKKSLGNRLDIAIRKGQDNQTIGIPVGPDTSRIISEIIVTAIDFKIQKKLSIKNDSAFRFVDDWLIGFDTQGEAENAVSFISQACKKFELELNHEKTCVISTRDSFEEIWPSELRQFNYIPSRQSSNKSLEVFFIKAFQFSKTFPNQNILDYAVKCSSSMKISLMNWRIYETFLLKAARANKTVIPSVVRILVSYNFENYPIDKKRIEKLIYDLLILNSPLAHHAEVAWALFLAKSLKIHISDDIITNISKLESSVCALIALDLRANKLISNNLDTSIWEQSLSTNGLRSNMWLLAYEANIKNWLKGETNAYVEKDKYFKVLKLKNISFYDVNKNLKHIEKQKPRKRSLAYIQFMKEQKEEIDIYSDGLEYPF